MKTLPLDNPRADKEPWRLWRYALAIVVAPVLGNVTAAIPAICLDIMAQRQITTPSSGDLTIPNTLYYCFMGGATGFFAGWIARRKGMLLGAVADFMPLLVLIVIEIVINRIPVGGNPAWTVWAGLGPAVIGGHYGQEFRLSRGLIRSVGRLIGLSIWIPATAVLFWFYLTALTHWLGVLFGSILAFAVAPGLLVFPLIYWVVEGVFPASYFVLLAFAFGGALLWGVSMDAD